MADLCTELRHGASLGSGLKLPSKRGLEIRALPAYFPAFG
ncbi:hypothetical protein OHAE_3278 [Ochrobactrum soli]|uniref:Uncharacterized protein n=1 Tax=Ochrobactrum soli TaxID=2448455 RepID=A0A2P9HGZ9_9HYPH|nr:hypothetical protein OHAE_3278 [[Ochrobactrum] soli]